MRNCTVPTGARKPRKRSGKQKRKRSHLSFVTPSALTPTQPAAITSVLYDGNRDTLTASLDFIQSTATAILRAITPEDPLR